METETMGLGELLRVTGVETSQVKKWQVDSEFPLPVGKDDEGLPQFDRKSVLSWCENNQARILMGRGFRADQGKRMLVLERARFEMALTVKMILDRFPKLSDHSLGELTGEEITRIADQMVRSGPALKRACDAMEGK